MKFFKNKIVVILAIIIVLLVVFFLLKNAQPDVPEFSSEPVERIDLLQTVSETGSVKAELELLYGWEIGGKIVDMLARVGDSVTSSQIIARLDSTKQQANLNEAYAALSSAQAKLNLELAGSSNEVQKKSLASIEQSKASLVQSEANLAKVEAQTSSNIVSAEKAVETANNNLQIVEGGEESELVNNAYADLFNDLQSSITTLSDALTESDNILGIDNTFANDDFDDVLSILNITALNTAKASYSQAKNAKQNAESDVAPLSYASDHVSLDVAREKVEKAIGVMQTHLTDVQQVLNATSPIGDLSQSELETLKSNINSARIAVNTSATNVTNAKQAVVTARNSLTSYSIAYDKALSDLTQAKKQADADIAVANAQVSAQEANLAQAQASHDDLIAPPRNVDVASLRAEVSRQVANVSAVQDQLKKTELVALSAGVISQLDVEVGENVIANQEVVGILSETLIIEVDISESDIAKVAQEDVVNITLDAYGEDVVFEGYVYTIEPAETEISGVVYYKTKIVFNNIPDQYDVRSGMTANVDIQTDIRKEVLVIPRRAVLTKEGKKIIRVVLNKERGVFEEREIVTGLSGDDGMVEVVSGLEEGDEVVTFLKEEK